jgi:hypothetical protein
MTPSALKERVRERIDELSAGQLERVAGYLDALAGETPEGTPTESLFEFLGSFDEESAREIAAAIEAHREQLEPDAG